MTDSLNMKLGITSGRRAPGYCGGRILSISGKGWDFNATIPRGFYISPCSIISQQMDKIRKRDKFHKYSLITGFGWSDVAFYIHDTIHSEDSLYDEFDEHTIDPTNSMSKFYLQTVNLPVVSTTSMIQIGGLSEFYGPPEGKESADTRIQSPISFDVCTAYLLFAKSPAGVVCHGVTKQHNIEVSRAALRFMHYIYKNSKSFNPSPYTNPSFKAEGATATRVLPLNDEHRSRLGIYSKHDQLYFSALPTFNNHTYPDKHKACAMMISDRPIAFQKVEEIP